MTEKNRIKYSNYDSNKYIMPSFINISDEDNNKNKNNNNNDDNNKNNNNIHHYVQFIQEIHGHFEYKQFALKINEIN